MSSDQDSSVPVNVPPLEPGPQDQGGSPSEEAKGARQPQAGRDVVAGPNYRRGAALVAVAVLTTITLAVLAVVAVAHSGVINVAATQGHLPGVRWVLETTQESSVARHSESVEVPADLDSPRRRARGLASYADMCVQCHGAPGVSPDPIGKGLNPSPPKFHRDDPVEILDHPRRVFWVVKHGIGMTGMPSFGRTHSDEELWDLAAFLPELPRLSDEEYSRRLSELRRRGGGHRHGGTGQRSSGADPSDARDSADGHEHRDSGDRHEH